MDDVVEVTIPVEAQAAAALADAGTREMVGRLVSRMLAGRVSRPADTERLMDAITRLKAEAHARDLTDEIVDEELAAYNAERREPDSPAA